MAAASEQGLGPSDFPEKFARRARMNHEAMCAYMAAIAFLAVIFIVSHLTRRAIRRWRLGQTSPYLSFFVTVSRRVRSVLMRKVPALPSAGHAVVILVYTAINLAITFTHMDNNNMRLHSNLASRTGWMAVANTVLVVFLSLKNTPLAYLAARSYERLNILHRVAGYTTVLFVVAHASLYSSFFVLEGRAEILTSREDVFGIVAGVAFLLLAASGAVVRRWSYELFYCLHLAAWLTAIVAVALHQPAAPDKIIWATCAAAAVWLLDRVVRAARFALCSPHNAVALAPLPHGGTRVVLARPPPGAAPGRHCFLWIPGVRRCEMHPFTIAAVAPAPELVVASYDGFTCDLHRFAARRPGAALGASAEGAYGAFPDPAAFDRAVLVAGGSGASFTFGMALNMLAKMDPGCDEQRSIVFVWMVKQRSYLTWFEHHLATIVGDKHVTVRLFVTRGSPEKQTEVRPATSEQASSVTNAGGTERALEPGQHTPIRSISIDSEKSLPSTESSSSTDGSAVSYDEAITYMRPDVTALIHDETAAAPSDKRVLVVGCGPEGLMAEVRNATAAACVRPDGPSVELHCEQFRW